MDSLMTTVMRLIVIGYERGKMEFTQVPSFLLTIISVCLFESCTTTSALTGSWEQRGFGRIMEIDGSNFSYYTVTHGYCKQLTSGNLYEHFQIVRANQNELVINHGSTKDYYFNRIDNLSFECSTRKDIVNNDFVYNFNILWNIYNDNYAFFEKRGVDWDKIKENYLSKIEMVKSEYQFYQMVKRILDSLNDGHVKLNVPDSISMLAAENSEVGFERVKLEIPNAVLNKYIDKPKSYNNKTISWGIITGTNVGYIVVPRMFGFPNYGLSDEEFNDMLNQVFAADPGPGIEYFQDEVEGVDHVMKEIYSNLSQTDSIILDLRFNEGGFNSVAMQILSHFISKPYKAFSTTVEGDGEELLVQDYVIKPSESNVFDKEVFLLTSHWTASAAEALVLSTLSGDNFARYGSTTSGVFSEMVWAVLPNNWEVSMSVEIISGPNNIGYEVSGIPPDYSMDYPDNVSEFYKSFYVSGKFRDPLIEKISKSSGF